MAQPPSAVDDDDTAPDDDDDDTSPDDDTGPDDDDTWPDDDDDSTTTTTTTTSSSTSTTRPTTTTVPTTTTSTTTTTGDGSAYNPFVVSAEEVVPEVPYGPWPAFERDGVTFQQILSSAAGGGMNDVVIAGDGSARVVGQDGISLDVWTIDPAGNVSRETVSPYGGETKLMATDNDDHLHIVYTFNDSPAGYGYVDSLLYSTNESGAWETVTLVENVPYLDYPLFDMAVDPDTGVVHLIYSDFTQSDDNVYYATYDHGVWESEALAAPAWHGWLNIALDGEGSPHLMYYDPDGTQYWHKDGGEWVHELVSDIMAPWDLLVDESGTLHMAADGDLDYALYYGVQTETGWEFEKLDDCRPYVTSVTLRRDGGGHIHIVYSEEHGYNVKYVTNRSGSWVFTTFGTDRTKKAWDMSSAVDANGHVHIVHRRESTYPESLYYTTNASGPWKRYTLAAMAIGLGDRVAKDSEDNLHFFMPRTSTSQMIYGALSDGVWTEEVVHDVAGTFPDRDIFVDQDGGVHVVWEDGVVGGTLHYGHKTGDGWELEDVDVSATYFSDVALAVGSDNVPHVAYSGAENDAQFTRYAFREADTWSVENMPDIALIDGLALNSSANPAVAYSGSVGSDTGAVIARRSQAGTWTTEMANDHTGLTSLVSTRDDSLHLLTASSRDYFYSTDETGDWVTQTLPLGYGNEVGDSLVIDSAGIAHVTAYEPIIATPGGNGSALIYQTNKNGAWEWAPLFWEKNNPYSLSLHELSDGRLLAVMGVDGATMTVTFDPGIVP